MAERGNPNPTGRKADKIVRDALLAALRQDPERLKKAAEKAWDKAIEGDLTAFKEIADRIDGKAPQAIVGDSDYDPIITQDYNARLIELARKAGVIGVAEDQALQEDGK
jgi:hypothetical protein